MAGSAINMVHKPGMVDERYRNVSSSTPRRESRVTYNESTKTAPCRLYDHELGLERLPIICFHDNRMIRFISITASSPSSSRRNRERKVIVCLTTGRDCNLCSEINNFEKRGKNLEILGSRWRISAGVGQSNRKVITTFCRLNQEVNVL